MVREIYNAFVAYYDGNTLYALDSMNDILKSIDKNHVKIIGELRQLIVSESIRIGICPVCGEELSLIRYDEIHTELDNNPIEVFEDYICEYCGWN